MNTGYPTLNFGLGEEMDMLRDAVYQMCQKEIAPRAAQIDRDNEFPGDLWRKFGDMGLLGITVDEAIRRQQHGLPRPLRGHGRNQPRLGLGGPVLRRHVQPVPEPDAARTAAKSKSKSTCPNCAAANTSARWPCPSPMPAPTWSA